MWKEKQKIEDGGGGHKLKPIAEKRQETE